MVDSVSVAVFVDAVRVVGIVNSDSVAEIADSD
jgi:hypothetical protein